VSGLFAADAGAGEEITEAGSLLALRLNEKFLALEVAGVFECSGVEFVLVGVGFQTQGFGRQSVVKTDAYLVGFAIELDMRHGDLGMSFVAG
jgi:hypothetical protein